MTFFGLMKKYLYGKSFMSFVISVLSAILSWRINKGSTTIMLVIYVVSSYMLSWKYVFYYVIYYWVLHNGGQNILNRY